MFGVNPLEWSPAEMARPRSATDGHDGLPEWCAEVSRAWMATGKNQGDYAAQVGVSQQTISAWVCGEKEPSINAIRWLIAKGGARPDPFRPLVRITDAAGGPQDDYTETRRLLFKNFLAKLVALNEAAGTRMDRDDLAWRAHTLFTRAVLLDHPEALTDRLQFILAQERCRLKRGDDR